MSRPEKLYYGYVDAGADGLLPVEIIKQDDGYISAWVCGEMADDAGNDMEEFIAIYGEWLYLTMDSYRTGENQENVRDVWK
jgi:hypothetical protein